MSLASGYSSFRSFAFYGLIKKVRLQCAKAVEPEYTHCHTSNHFTINYNKFNSTIATLGSTSRGHSNTTRNISPVTEIETT